MKSGFWLAFISSFLIAIILRTKAKKMKDESELFINTDYWRKAYELSENNTQITKDIQTMQQTIHENKQKKEELENWLKEHKYFDVGDIDYE